MRATQQTDHHVAFPPYSGVRCLMMPYIQGDPDSVPDDYASWRGVIASVALVPGDVGFLTIDESPARAGMPHRGYRAKFGRALHTEAGLYPGGRYKWGSGPAWHGTPTVMLDRDVRVLLANNVDGSCAIWDAEHEDTSEDGDIGDQAARYPYDDAIIMKAGDVHELGILTPHESLPVTVDCERQFLRIISSGVHGREDYFTVNPRM